MQVDLDKLITYLSANSETWGHLIKWGNLGSVKKRRGAELSSGPHSQACTLVLTQESLSSQVVVMGGMGTCF
jgi:hypothetical protein